MSEATQQQRLEAEALRQVRRGVDAANETLVPMGARAYYPTHVEIEPMKQQGHEWKLKAAALEAAEAIGRKYAEEGTGLYRNAVDEFSREIEQKMRPVFEAERRRAEAELDRLRQLHRVAVRPVGVSGWVVSRYMKLAGDSRWRWMNMSDPKPLWVTEDNTDRLIFETYAEALDAARDAAKEATA